MREILGILGEHVDEAWLDHGERIREKGSISHADIVYEDILFRLEETLTRCGAQRVVKTLHTSEINQMDRDTIGKRKPEYIPILSVEDQFIMDATRATIERSLLQILRVDNATRAYSKEGVEARLHSEQSKKFSTAK
jgi:hypothetical protein